MAAVPNNKAREREKDKESIPEVTSTERRRSLRNQIRPNYREFLDSSNDYTENTKPKNPMKNPRASIEQYYLDQTVKRLPSSFETIYEEPIVNGNNETVYMSKKKLKRMITVPNLLNKVPPNKLKIRKKKAKLLAGKRTLKKISKKYFMEVLNNIEPPESPKIVENNED